MPFALPSFLNAAQDAFKTKHLELQEKPPPKLTRDLVGGSCMASHHDTGWDAGVIRKFGDALYTQLRRDENDVKREVTYNAWTFPTRTCTARSTTASISTAHFSSVQ